MDLMSMTLDVSKLSGWLNADANCRVEKRARCGPGGGRAWAGRSAHAASTGGKGPTEGRGASACAERTENMLRMVVTLDVSQLEMFALICFKPAKSPLMSVMAETSQSAMGPYVAVAAVGLA